MSIVDVNSGDSGGGVPATRTINTALPLTGGGPLSADLNLAVNDATTTTVGVVKLAANLAGTGVLPLVTGLTADVITVQNLTGLTHKGVWNTVGLRIGDNTAPTEKLEVAGRAVIGVGAAQVFIDSLIGATATFGSLWMGPITPSATNYAFASNGSTAVVINIPTGGQGFFNVNGSGTANYSASGFRIGDTTAATEKLDVVGNATASGSVIANNGATRPWTIRSWTADTVNYNALYSVAVPGTTNYCLLSDGGSLFVNAPLSGIIYFGQGHVAMGQWQPAGLRVGDATTPGGMLDVNGNSLLGRVDESSLSTLRGGELGTVHEVSTAYTVDSGTLTDRLIVVLASGSSVTITLPPTSNVLPPTGTKGRKIIIKRKYGSDSSVFVSADGADTIEGAGNAITLSSPDDGIEPFCEVEDDGTSWQVTRIHGGSINP